MDVVSFETAKKLKEAGFPQPELAPPPIPTKDRPHFGLAFYGPDGEMAIVTEVIRDNNGLKVRFIRKSTGNGYLLSPRQFLENWFFAPTAMDILRTVAGGSPAQITYWPSVKEFEAGGRLEENPAEACAADVWQVGDLDNQIDNALTEHYLDVMPPDPDEQ
jgi:hypothetical protein